MEITGQITGIKYKSSLTEKLEKVDIKSFNINKIPTCYIVQDGLNTFAVSKWVSPKRTRSYTYERVYNMLNVSKKITITPIIKDEGCDGDRDFLQWDTVSLMLLFDVFVILAYYDKTEDMKNCPHKWLITYDDSEYIRNLFSFANVQSWNLTYGMRNITERSNQNGKELFISNFPDTYKIVKQLDLFKQE